MGPVGVLARTPQPQPGLHDPSWLGSSPFSIEDPICAPAQGIGWDLIPRAQGPRGAHLGPQPEGLVGMGLGLQLDGPWLGPNLEGPGGARLVPQLEGPVEVGAHLRARFGFQPEDRLGPSLRVRVGPVDAPAEPPRPELTWARLWAQTDSH